MPALGLSLPKIDVVALFDSWDPDGSGVLELKELEKQLRRGADVELDANLQARRSVLPLTSSFLTSAPSSFVRTRFS